MKLNSRSPLHPRTLHGLITAAVVAGAACSLSACAGGDRPERGGDRGRGGGEFAGGPHRQVNFNVFFSPMGEPFHGGPTDPYAARAWFDGANLAHDGHLTEAEFVKDADRFFDRLDTNHDGVIDGFEVADYEKLVAPEIQPNVGGLRAGEGMDASLGLPDGESGRRRGQGAPLGGPLSNQAAKAGDTLPQGAGVFSYFPDPEPVASAAANLNDHITRDDWRAAAHRRFKALDRAARGYLVFSELPKTPIEAVFLARKKAMEHRPQASPKPTNTP